MGQHRLIIDAHTTNGWKFSLKREHVIKLITRVFSREVKLKTIIIIVLSSLQLILAETYFKIFLYNKPKTYILHEMTGILKIICSIYNLF